MRTLFWKVFAFFWATQVAVLLLALLIPSVGRVTPSLEDVRRDLPILARQAVTLWEADDMLALRHELTTFTATHGVRVWLLDSHQREVSQNETPVYPYMKRLYESNYLSQSEPEQFLDFLPEGPSRAVTRPRSHEPTFRVGAPSILTADITGTQDHYLIVAELIPRPWHGIPFRQAIRQLMVGFVLGGLACFVLAHSLTRPIVGLRHATQAVAAGDLSARAGMQVATRRDEIGDLGRDFDLMALRIQDLLHSQTRLLRDISHDLRSPLQRLRMALGLARRHDGTLDSQLDRIEREAVRMDALIGQLLTLAKLDAAAQVLPPMSELNLNEIIRQVITDAGFEAEKTGRMISVTGISEVWVRGNDELLHSALENVIRNAVRHTEPATTVEIKVTTNAGHVSVVVRDHGPGLPHSAFPNLFQPFFRADESRPAGTGGFGLGLAISARAVQLHGGTIQATNVEPRGLAVEISLPVLSNPKAQDLASATGSSASDAPRASVREIATSSSVTARPGDDR